MLAPARRGFADELAEAIYRAQQTARPPSICPRRVWPESMIAARRGPGPGQARLRGGAWTAGVNAPSNRVFSARDGQRPASDAPRRIFRRGGEVARPSRSTWPAKSIGHWPGAASSCGHGEMSELTPRRGPPSARADGRRPTPPRAAHASWRSRSAAAWRAFDDLPRELERTGTRRRRAHLAASDRRHEELALVDARSRRRATAADRTSPCRATSTACSQLAACASTSNDLQADVERNAGALRGRGLAAPRS